MSKVKVTRRRRSPSNQSFNTHSKHVCSELFKNEFFFVCKYSMKPAFCYILHNSQGQTYTGYTVDLNKRLRQHNGELCGGARYTHGKGPWKFLCHMTSSSLDKCLAMSLEWWLKHPTGHKRRPTEYQGIEGRLRAVTHVCKQPKFADMKFEYYVDPCVCELSVAKSLLDESLHVPENEEKGERIKQSN